MKTRRRGRVRTVRLNRRRGSRRTTRRVSRRTRRASRRTRRASRRTRRGSRRVMGRMRRATRRTRRGSRKVMRRTRRASRRASRRVSRRAQVNVGDDWNVDSDDFSTITSGQKKTEPDASPVPEDEDVVVLNKRPKKTKKTKKGKKPSEYNLFMKKMLPELKKQFPDKQQKELFKLVGEAWKKQK